MKRHGLCWNRFHVRSPKQQGRIRRYSFGLECPAKESPVSAAMAIQCRLRAVHFRLAFDNRQAGNGCVEQDGRDGRQRYAGSQSLPQEAETFAIRCNCGSFPPRCLQLEQIIIHSAAERLFFVNFTIHQAMTFHVLPDGN